MSNDNIKKLMEQFRQNSQNKMKNFGKNKIGKTFKVRKII